MNRRIERAAAFFLVLTPIILEASWVLAILGIWNWGLAAIYAVSNACLALTMFEKCRWRKKIFLWLLLEALQILGGTVFLGIPAMF